MDRPILPSEMEINFPNDFIELIGEDGKKCVEANINIHNEKIMNSAHQIEKTMDEILSIPTDIIKIIKIYSLEITKVEVATYRSNSDGEIIATGLFV